MAQSTQTNMQTRGRKAATLTKKQLEKISSRLKSGEFLSNFYAEYNLSLITIRNILKKNDMQTHRIKPTFFWSRDKNRLLKKMVKENKSVDEIQLELVGANKLDILNQMKALNINRKRGWTRIGKVKPIDENNIELAKKMYIEGNNHRRIAIAIGLMSSGNPRYKNIILPILQELPAPTRKLRTGAKKINDENAIDIVNLYNSKTTISDIAKKYDVSYPAIIQVLKREGIELKKKNNLTFDDEIKQNEIKEYFINGGTISKLADDYEYSVPGMRNVLMRYNLLPTKTEKKNIVNSVDSIVKTKSAKKKSEKENIIEATEVITNNSVEPIVTDMIQTKRRFRHNPFDSMSNEEMELMGADITEEDEIYA